MRFELILLQKITAAWTWLNLFFHRQRENMLLLERLLQAATLLLERLLLSTCSLMPTALCPSLRWPHPPPAEPSAVLSLMSTIDLIRPSYGSRLRLVDSTIKRVHLYNLSLKLIRFGLNEISKIYSFNSK